MVIIADFFVDGSSENATPSEIIIDFLDIRGTLPWGGIVGLFNKLLSNEQLENFQSKIYNNRSGRGFLRGVSGDNIENFRFDDFFGSEFVVCDNVDKDNHCSVLDFVHFIQRDVTVKAF